MNEQERFHHIFQGEPVDRPPLLDEGVRDEVLDRWHTEGMPRGKTHLEIFGLTPHENVGPDLRFPSQSLGRIMDLDMEGYRKVFQASHKRFPEDWPDTVKRLENRGHIACLWAYRGFFQALGVGNWATLKQVFRAVHTRAQDVREKMEIYGDFCARMLEMTLEQVKPDFIFLSEPISNTNGPLISPDMFETFAIPAYKTIIETARAHKIRHILVSTYGNTEALFPHMIRNGVNILWVSEAAEMLEMDYVKLRDKYGPELGLIGGIPLSILRSKSVKEMEQRIHDTVSPLLCSGRYIPLAGGRVREEISWEIYSRYREILADMLGS